jgi:hypothetical protein
MVFSRKRNTSVPSSPHEGVRADELRFFRIDGKSKEVNLFLLRSEDKGGMTHG